MLSTRLRPLLVTVCLLLMGTVAWAQPPAPPAPPGVDLADQEEIAFKQAAALVDSTVVRLETVGGLERIGEVSTVTGPTTGIVVSSDGYLLTSSFNFAGKPSSILATLPDGRRLPAQLVATDHSRMLTLIKIDAENLVPAVAPPPGTVRVGQWAIALGRTYDGPLPSLSVGIVSAVGRIWGKAIQTDAKISPVNYGGALIDIQGRMLGLLVPLSPQEQGEVAGVEWYDGGIGFAIPTADALAAAEKLKAGQDLYPGLLGISVKAASKLDGAATLDRVRFGSPADQAGLKVGDLLVEVAGRPIRRYSDLQTALGTKYAGETISIQVRRGDETLKREATLVDKLLPYEAPSLGILPIRNDRDAERPTGVTVRALVPDSPAATSGLARGDRIVSLGGEAIRDAAALEKAISRSKPGDQVSLGLVTSTGEKSVTLKLSALPADILSDLAPDLLKPAQAANPNGPKTGRLAETVAAHDREFWAYVPDDYSPANSYGLVVWIHPTGDTQEAEQLDRWRPVCQERGLILLAPKAKELGQWSPADAVFAKELIERFVAEYTIDPRRVVVHGQGNGGFLAAFLASKNRSLIRGLCTVGSPLRQQPPDTDPDARQQYLLIAGDKDTLFPQIEESLKLLEQMKYPVSRLIVPGATTYPTGDTWTALIRWIDSLDRL